MNLCPDELDQINSAARRVPPHRQDEYFGYIADRLRPLVTIYPQDLRAAIGTALNRYARRAGE